MRLGLRYPLGFPCFFHMVQISDDRRPVMWSRVWLLKVCFSSSICIKFGQRSPLCFSFLDTDGVIMRRSFSMWNSGRYIFMMKKEWKKESISCREARSKSCWRTRSRRCRVLWWRWNICMTESARSSMI